LHRIFRETLSSILSHVAAGCGHSWNSAGQRRDSTYFGLLAEFGEATFRLHASWNELKRYTNLKPENLRDIAPAGASKPRAKRRKSSAR